MQFRPGGPEGDTPTGRCIIVVTPDAQRTMNTYLGVSSLLAPDDVDADTVAAGDVLYMEGYLYDRPAAMDAFRFAASVAHESGRRVSLTLSDSFCVDRHREHFRSLVCDEVDLLLSERVNCRPRQEYGADRSSLAHERDAECGAKAATFLSIE